MSIEKVTSRSTVVSEKTLGVSDFLPVKLLSTFASCQSPVSLYSHSPLHDMPAFFCFWRDVSADKDECLEGSHDCSSSQVCVNSPGSFMCKNNTVPLTTTVPTLHTRIEPTTTEATVNTSSKASPPQPCHQNCKSLWTLNYWTSYSTCCLVLSLFLWWLCTWPNFISPAAEYQGVSIDCNSI